jgi:hypothetical protein
MARLNAPEPGSERGKLVEGPNQVAIPSAAHRILYPSLNFFLITQLYASITRAKKKIERRKFNYLRCAVPFQRGLMVEI